MRGVVAGIAGLALIGGVGSVVYNHNGATVQIKGPNGKVQSVHLDFGKKQFQCPSGESAKLQPLLIKQGRIKLTLQGVEKDLRQILKQYPGRHPHPPHAVRVRVETEYARLKPLAKAYSAAVHQYNAALERDCTAG